MAEYELLYEPFPDEDLKHFVFEGVELSTVAKTGLADWHPANFFMQNARGEWIGGIFANAWGEWLHIKALWVHGSEQGKGCGKRLLQSAEAFAIEKGCRSAWLETFSFEARPFYERFGYEVFGELKDYPKGHMKYFMRKNFAAGKG